MATSIVVLGKGFRPALYFLVARVFLLVATTAQVVRGFGVIPTNVMTTNVLLAGAAIEAILLSIGLAQWISSLKSEHRKLAEQQRRLSWLSVTDELTGLFNKRLMLSKIIAETEHARRINQPFSVVVLDIDFFKKYNDTYGHLEGDKVLALMGRIIMSSIRSTDIACRFGGEEFVVLLPNTDVAGARIVAERVRKSFLTFSLFPQSGLKQQVTLSAGVSQLMADETHAELLERADKALYASKSAGRNTVVVANCDA